MRMFKITYRSSNIDMDKNHICEGLVHSDGQVYLRGYTIDDEKLFKSIQEMLCTVFHSQDYSFCSIEWIDGNKHSRNKDRKKAEDTSLFNVMADAILTHYSAKHNITLTSGDILAIYYVNKSPRWKVTSPHA